jgi:hypothetical protein
VRDCFDEHERGCLAEDSEHKDPACDCLQGIAERALAIDAGTAMLALAIDAGTAMLARVHELEGIVRDFAASDAIDLLVSAAYAARSNRDAQDLINRAKRLLVDLRRRAARTKGDSNG